MRRFALAFALSACAAKSPAAIVVPTNAAPPPSAAASTSASASAKTEGAVTVTFFDATGGVPFDDAGVAKPLAACATSIGSARGWLLLELDIGPKGETTGVKIVERTGLPESVASCVTQRLRAAWPPGKLVYLSVQ
jgi:hypothetical protein